MKKKVLLSLFFCGLFLITEAQWIPQASNFASPSRGIKYICAVDTNVVWATAYDGSSSSAPEIQEFTRTTNGGAKWKARSISGYAGDGLSMVCAVDSMNAWIPVWYASGGGTIIRTSDGGVSWNAQTTALFTSPSGFPNVVHFWNINEGFCMGDPNGGYFEIYTTIDGGTTWVRVPQTDIPAKISGEYGTTGLYCVVGDIVWYTTNKGRVYKSIDKGYHWTVSATPNTSEQMKISFKDANYGIVQVNVSPYNAYFTIDGGASWQQLLYSGNFYANDFCHVPGTASTYISTGADYTNNFMGTSYSIDDGLTWNVIPLSDTAQFLSVDFVDYKHGWAGNFNIDSLTDGMWKYNGNIFIYDSCAGFAAFFAKSADTLDLNTTGLCDFTDLSSGNPTGWTWDFGDGGNSTTQNPSHTYTTTGTYIIELTATKGSSCNSVHTDSVVVVNTSGIEKYSDGTAVEIWPNPAKDYLHIASSEIIATIELFNSYGQKVYYETNNSANSKINVSNLSPDIYFIRINTVQGRTDGRFIITK